ncbi:MAG TPA: cytochrome c biogenesis protein CcdA [Candidatus Saccharibacteria bacterium]|nr:cytochrome c biogenesis protein CcdA [Candidatus Saccharibacteria bacterium]
MVLFLLTFLAGVLTVAAPCILPLLPLVIGGSSSRSDDSKTELLRRALVIIGSLALSVFIFTMLLKATTSLLGVPQVVWQLVSGGIVLAIGLNFLFPEFWLTVSEFFGLPIRANKHLGLATKREGWLGSVATGAALGPVFSSCSPTYALILAAVLPVSFGLGVLYLLSYILGMSLALLIVALFGAAVTRKLGWALDEHGLFRRVIGVLFVLVGLAVILGWDKSVQTYLLEHGVYNGTSGLEENFQSFIKPS